MVSRIGFSIWVYILEGAIGRAVARRYSYLLEESPGSSEQAAR
jgi:hypothetical protein